MKYIWVAQAQVLEATETKRSGMTYTQPPNSHQQSYYLIALELTSIAIAQMEDR